MLNQSLKVGCLIIYALALAGAMGALPVAATNSLRFVALALLAVHLVELLFVFKAVKRYRGPLAVSVVLALLFGLLHWMPLMRQGQAQQGKA